MYHSNLFLEDQGRMYSTRRGWARKRKQNRGENLDLLLSLRVVHLEIGK